MPTSLQKQAIQHNVPRNDSAEIIDFPNKSSRDYQEASALLDPARDSFGILFEPFLLETASAGEGSMSDSFQWDVLDLMTGDHHQTGRAIRIPAASLKRASKK